jgi:hypothetical protein
VRRIQDLRKTAGFDIADRIVTHYTASAGLAQAMAAHADYVRGETLSVDLVSAPAPDRAATAEDSFDGERLKLGLVVVKPGQGRRRTARKSPATVKKTTARSKMAAPRSKVRLPLVKAKGRKPARRSRARAVRKGKK